MQRNRTRPALSPGFFGLRATAPSLPEAGLGRLRRAPRIPRARPPRAALSAVTAALEAAPAAAAISPEQRLLQRATLGPSLADLELIEDLGYGGYLAEQLNPERLDNRELEGALAEWLPSLALSPAEIYSRYEDDTWAPIFELITASLYRSVYSPRQLFESLVVFWSDHFNIDIFGDTGWFLKLTDDRDVIRRHALGSFPALLKASAHSPAMLTYLTNDSNHKEHPNQNYARELMELHTLGADNGYTQQDVEEVARCFTGWTLIWDETAEMGRFWFDADAHDNGRKTVLGQRIAGGGGIRDGEQVLEILAGHPNTARFISRKLLRYFWGYEPPQGYVEQVAGIYLRTGGNLRAMLRSILKRGWMATATPKLKRPYHLLVSAVRALFAGVEDPSFLLDAMQQAGHLPFSWSPPNGYPDARGYWSGFLLPRWSALGSMAADPGGTGLAFDFDSYLDPALSPQALTQRIQWLVSNGTLSESTQAVVRNFLRAAPRSQERIQEALSLAFLSPDFQDY